jgi:uncharacterized protein
MRKIFLIFSLGLILSSGCDKQSPAVPSVNQNVPSPYNQTLAVKDTKLSVQVMTTLADKAQGLSGRDKTENNQGMLFDFGTGAAEIPTFWMKDMKFNLDFIWIKNGKIIGITPNAAAPASPGEKLSLYNPPSPIDQVLEVNAGWAETNNIKTGDEVRLVK